MKFFDGLSAVVCLHHLFVNGNHAARGQIGYFACAFLQGGNHIAIIRGLGHDHTVFHNLDLCFNAIALFKSDGQGRALDRDFGVSPCSTRVIISAT